MEMQELDALVGIDAVTTRYRVTLKTARRWCREGKFPGALQVGREWRIPTKSVANPVANRPPPGVVLARSGVRQGEKQDQNKTA